MYQQLPPRGRAIRVSERHMYIRLTIGYAVFA